MLPITYYQFLKEMFLLPEWWKQLPKAALQKQKNNENCHPGKTWYSYFHPEQGGHCDSLQWPHPQIVQEDRYLKREKQSLLQFSCSVLSDSLWPHEPHHTRPPCKLLTPGVYPNSCPLSRWAIQPSHPLSSPSPPAFNQSQHQGHFKWVSSSHQVAEVLEFELQH